MSTTDNTLRTVIRDVTHHGTSSLGNPTKKVVTDHGTFITQANTSWAYEAENSEWRDAHVTLHLSRHGRIRWAKKVDLVELARDRYRATHEAQGILRDSIKPALTVETRGGAPVLVCPGCDETLDESLLRTVDFVERWATTPIDFEHEEVRPHYDYFADFDGVSHPRCYLATCCFTPVDLPAGWTENEN